MLITFTAIILQSNVFSANVESPPDVFFDRIRYILTQKYKIVEVKAECIKDELHKAGAIDKIYDNQIKTNLTEIDKRLKPFYFNSEKQCNHPQAKPEEFTFTESGASRYELPESPEFPKETETEKPSDPSKGWALSSNPNVIVALLVILLRKFQLDT